MWNVSTERSRSTRDRNRSAAARERRQVEAERLRQFAGGLNNTDGQTVANICVLSGQTDSVVRLALEKAKTPSETLWAVQENSRTTVFLADAAGEVLRSAGTVHGQWAKTVSCDAGQWLTADG